MRPELQKKVDRAIRLLQSIPTDKGKIEVSYSGGKDSDVILELARMSGIPYEAIYKNTTIDPSGTIAHCKENGVTILNPEKTFFQLVAEYGYPHRFRRFCCSYLKEYKVHNHAIHGIRRSESRKRAEKYKEPQVCRVYGKDKRVSVYLPILEWSDKDIEEFIKERRIKCHPLYYKNGEFDVKQRLGCMGCPLASRLKRIKFFEENPKMLKAWIDAGQRHFTSNGKRFTNAYDAMFCELFYDSYKDYEEKCLNVGLFESERIDAKAFLEEHFKITL